jgi:hypothetical protein
MKTNSSNLVRTWGAMFALAGLSLAMVSSTANAATTATTVSSAVGATISLLSSNGTVTINTTPTGAGVQTIASDTVTVSSNDSAGYTLKLAETAAATALTSGANTIPATAGTYATPVAMAVNTWGYRIDSLGSFGAGPTSGISNQAIGSATFAAVPATASPQTIKTTAATATNDTTTVWYGVATNTSQPSGTYTNSVTYTATAN